jgi:hypothetical protein
MTLKLSLWPRCACPEVNSRASFSKIRHRLWGGAQELVSTALASRLRVRNERLAKFVCAALWLIQIIASTALGQPFPAAASPNVTIYYDASISMQGFLPAISGGRPRQNSGQAPSTASEYQDVLEFLEDEAATLKRGVPDRYRFGKTIKPGMVKDLRSVLNRSFYVEPQTRLDQVFAAGNSPGVKIIVTDLLQNDGDALTLVNAVDSAVLRKNLALAVVAVAARFDGTVDPKDFGGASPLEKFKGSLPFYILLYGDQPTVLRLARRLQQRLGRAVVFPPQSTDHHPTDLQMAVPPGGSIQVSSGIRRRPALPGAKPQEVRISRSTSMKSGVTLLGSVTIRRQFHPLLLPAAPGAMQLSATCTREDNAQDQPGVVRAFALGNGSEVGDEFRQEIVVDPQYLESGVGYHCPLEVRMDNTLQALPGEWGRLAVSSNGMKLLRQEQLSVGWREELNGRTPNLTRVLSNLYQRSNPTGGIVVGRVDMYIKK